MIREAKEYENNWKHKKNRLKHYFKTLSNSWFYLPVIFIGLNCLTVTNLDNYNNLTLLITVDFDHKLVTLMKFVGNLLFVIVFVSIMTSSFSGDSRYLILLAPAVACLFNFFMSLALFSPETTLTTNSILLSLCNFCIDFGLHIPLAMLWSQLSKHFVDGFETTGASIMVSIYDFGVLLSYFISDPIMKTFQVDRGYMERLKGPLICFIVIDFLFILNSVLFLHKRPPSNKF